MFFFFFADCKGVADHPEIVEDAIKYIIFLSDVNKLYDVALGMYNFQLVLMIAQYSQKASPTLLPRPAALVSFVIRRKLTNLRLGSERIPSFPARTSSS